MVRVRFAPSPTGYVHVGNARTALFNWLFARHEGGIYILRIEDTDVDRSEARFEKQLLDDLRWLGLDWDEGPDVGGPFGPYRQSERQSFYHQYAAQLLDAGQAYFCFCTPEQLEAEREEALKAGRQPRYSGRCRTRPREESARKVAEGQPAAIRLKITGNEFEWRDRVHGSMSFESDVIGDFILVRSDGHPAYNFAVVIDDHLMEISNVIRGDDHISNTPRQLAVYRALGWQPPEFAHLSTILGPDRTRLSKRHGATSLEQFRAMGILPEALRNYLALLGWSPADGKTEILNSEELTRQFSLDHITKSPAIFDWDKMRWLNRHYMKQTPLPYLAALSQPFLAEAGYISQEADDRALAWLERVLDAVLKNVGQLDQLPSAAKLIFEYDASAILRRDETRGVAEEEGARAVLEAFIPAILAEEDLTYERFRAAAQSVCLAVGKKGKELYHPIRVALTGEVSGPELEKLIPIFEQGSRLPLKKHVKSCAERLREFAAAAKLG